MTIASKLILLAVLFSALATSTFVVSSLVTAQVSPVEDALQTGEKAYTELQAADKAGADITALAVRFNAALGLWENASRLEGKGDETTASTIASQAEKSFQAIIPDAQSLRDAAVSKRQEEAAFRLYAIPIGALIVAVAAVAALVVYRRIQSRQFGELRIRAKVGG